MKLKFRTLTTLTGLPECSAGLNSHCLAACNAASRNNGCPSMAAASITLPSSETMTIIFTSPSAFAAFASGGKTGSTFLIAEACNIPPETLIESLGTGKGAGGGGGGGGTANSSFCDFSISLNESRKVEMDFSLAPGKTLITDME